MSPPVVEQLVDRALLILRSKLAEKGISQTEVQHELKWGGTYVSQLFRKQKGLRLDQILSILSVIEVSPESYFRELFSSSTPPIPLPEQSSIDELIAILRGHPTDLVIVSLAAILVQNRFLRIDDLISMMQTLKQG